MNSYLIELENEKPEIISEKRKIASSGRKTNQPLRFRSAGSVFKNPKNYAAGYLIDRAGLKGVQKGNAMISDKHANFIVNLGGASSHDVVYLIKLIKQKVFQKFQVNLELEVRLLGFENDLIEEISCYA